MPDVPTPGVKGHELPLQPCTSISSLEPAASTLGELASTAIAGSFCLFWAKGDGGLPEETRVSFGAAVATVAAINAAITTGIAETLRIKSSSLGTAAR